MESTNKYKLKKPTIYQKTFMKNSNSNNIGTSYALNPLQKYNNAFNNLREGLNELEYLNINKEKNMNNNTYANAPINHLINNFPENKTVTDKSRRNRNKILLQSQEKNNLFPVNLGNSYNPFIPVTKQNRMTSENPNMTHQKSDYSHKNIKTYPNSVTDDENKHKKIMKKEPKQINIVKMDNNLYNKKINDLTKNIKIFQMNNQKLIKDKNNLLDKIGSIEKQLKKTKNFMMVN